MLLPQGLSRGQSFPCLGQGHLGLLETPRAPSEGWASVKGQRMSSGVLPGTLALPAVGPALLLPLPLPQAHFGCPSRSRNSPAPAAAVWPTGADSQCWEGLGAAPAPPSPAHRGMWCKAKDLSGSLPPQVCQELHKNVLVSQLLVIISPFPGAALMCVCVWIEGRISFLPGAGVPLAFFKQ